MGFRHWIIGSVLGIAVIAPVAASSLDAATRDPATSQPHTAADASATRDSDTTTANGGDAAGLTHGNAGNVTPEPASDGPGNPGGGPTSTSDRGSMHHSSAIGWQSLLPGSIQ
jgi:hypothetical protein